jgi:hypothetical protein
MRDLWQTTNMNYGAKWGLATNPKRFKSTGIRRIIERALWEQGIRELLKDGEKRHEWKAAHGFRKFYKSRAEQVMKPINVEDCKTIVLEEAEKLYNDLVDQLVCEVINESVTKQSAETMPSSLPALPLEEGGADDKQN